MKLPNHHKAHVAKHSRLFYFVETVMQIVVLVGLHKSLAELTTFLVMARHLTTVKPRLEDEMMKQDCCQCSLSL